MSNTTESPDLQESAAVKTYAARSFAAQSAESPLAAHSIQRRSPQEHDVQIEILFCGVCHSDLHQARNEWVDFMPTVYPCVPGHEIVGRVTKVGSAVKKFKEGDIAAVGCMVNSCGICESCKEGLQQHCDNNAAVFTYNSEDKILGGVTYGGYSESIVVDENFALKVPKGLDPAGHRSAALRRNYHLFAAAALEGRQRPEGRHRGTRRPGAYGFEIRPCHGRAHCAVHYLGEQSR